MDVMVLATQKYLNENYGGKPGYNNVAENGNTGWATIYALTRALQIEFGLSAPADNFGNATTAAFKQRYPNGIKEQEAGAEETSRVYAIIQGALWCKGYSTGAGMITEHFYGGTGSAIKKLKEHAGFVNPDSTVTLNIMKALLSMDQFRVIYSQGGTSTIQSIQQQLNRKYEDYIGLIPCDGLYGRGMSKALIIVLQVIEGLSSPNGNFGNQTKANCPMLPDTTGILPAKTVEEATYLVKYALCCNGYEAGVTTPDWTAALETAIRDFQHDLKLEVTGTVNVDTWMSLLLSKGNPDRACTACDTRFEITNKRADELKRKGYNIVGRYLTGGEFKGLRDDEPQRILDKGLNFFPIFQESGTNIAYFTEARGKADADKAVRAARKFRIPEGNVIYFAVDLDATDPQITKYIKPYFKALSENFDTAFKVGIYGTRNVCTKICAENYAVASFVSDMSTGYSGNMGFKIPNNWNFDQYAEIDMDAASDGEWAIDKDAYAGRFEPVKELDSYVYVQPEKTPHEGLPSVDDVIPLLEELERVYVEWYTPLFEAAPQTVPYLSAQVLAAGVINFLRSLSYTEWYWAAALFEATDEGFVNYVLENYPNLYESLRPYMLQGEEVTLISDGKGGITDLKHVAATAGVYSSAQPVPDSWVGWAGDLATAMRNTEEYIEENGGSHQEIADFVVGNSNYSFPYEDFCCDADAIKIAELIEKSTSRDYAFAAAFKDYYENYVDNRYYYLLKDIECSANLSSIKDAVKSKMNGILSPLLMAVLGHNPSTETHDACCNAFANYIFCELA